MNKDMPGKSLGKSELSVPGNRSTFAYDFIKTRRNNTQMQRAGGIENYDGIIEMPR
jgi:hypothetical protein